MKIRVIALILLIVILLVAVVVQYRAGDVAQPPGAAAGGGKKAQPDTSAGGGGKQIPPRPELTPPNYRETEIPSTPVISSKEEAVALIREQQGELGFGAGNELEIEGSTADDFGNEYYQLTQTYKGVPVLGANSVLEVEDGKAVAISGSWDGSIDVDVTPRYQAEEAVRMALIKIGVREPIELSISEPEQLVIIITNFGTRLGWKVDVYYSIPSRDPERVVVDANDPELIFRRNLLLQ